MERLVSYYHLKLKGFGWNMWKQNKKSEKPINLFLDSGAYSAFTQNIEIDIYKYIKFIKKNKKYIDVYANLDVIGDDKATWKNQKIMEKEGLEPMPVYHRGDDIKYLYKCMEYPYFGLGGMATGVSTPQRISYLDKCWDIICDKKGMPQTKVHGFGMTSLKLLLRYPWYSVDSTSWVMTSRMGGVLIPRIRGGKCVYDENSLKMDVSSKSPSIKNKGQHINNITPRQRKIFLEYFKKKGFKLGESQFKKEDPKTYELKDNEKWSPKKTGDIEVILEPGLCNDYKLRDEINIIYFMDLEKSIPEWPWPMKLKKQGNLF